MTFDTEINKLLGEEGNYSNDPNDSGGPTIWGITEAVARHNGYFGDMQAMPRATAVNIYQTVYWYNAGCQSVDPFNSALSADLFECGVNIGVSTAGDYLQRALNALYPNSLVIDGAVGPATIAVIQKLSTARGPDGMAVLRSMFLSQVSCHYISLVEGNFTQAEFIYGWELNRILAAP